MNDASSPSTALRPWVLVPACIKSLERQPFHVVGDKYLEAVRLSGCWPLLMPAGPRNDAEMHHLLDLADGILLTGSPSNVHPSHFHRDVHDTALPLDPARDDLTLALIPQVLARGIPLLGICRGFQEVNVALGGSLHQAIHEVTGYAEHRAGLSTPEPPLAEQYGPSHPVRIVPGGTLACLLEAPSDIQVNSLHGQGVDQLAPGLRIEARAPDGLVEAFSMPTAPGFNLCVQWHPEWQAASNPVSSRLFAAFGQACRVHREKKEAQHQQ